MRLTDGQTDVHCNAALHAAQFGKNVRKQVVSTDARVKAELQLLHVGTSDVDSEHDEHWYGHPTHNIDKYNNQTLENSFVIYKQ